jgi:type I restriction enzyme S subunit
MSEWRVAPLREIADIRVSNVDKKAAPGEAPFRLCNYMDVYANDYIRTDLPFMEATATAAEIQRFGVQHGDVMITNDSETPDDIGIPAVVMDQIEGLVCGYHLAQIRPNRALVDPVYLAKQLALPETAAYFARRAAGSTRYGLSNRTIAEVPIRLAPLWQQRWVAEVLSRLDDSIERTQALIEKHQQIKAGLVEDLFTRGLTSNGEFRPKRSDAPTQYSATELGWLPKEWSVEGVNACGEVKLGRQRSPDQHSRRWPMPYLRVANVFDGFIDFDDVLSMDFTPNERRIFGLRDGDILLNEGQSLELVGRSAIYRGEDGQYCFQNTLVRFRCTDGHDPRFFAALFKRWLDSGQSQRIAKQTTSVAHLGAERFARMFCPCVPLPEQQLIAARIDSAVRVIEAERAALRKLRTIKLGLMQDLLTGRVRFPLPEPEVTA